MKYYLLSVTARGPGLTGLIKLMGINIESLPSYSETQTLCIFIYISHYLYMVAPTLTFPKVQVLEYDVKCLADSSKSNRVLDVAAGGCQCPVTKHPVQRCLQDK